MLHRVSCQQINIGDLNCFMRNADPTAPNRDLAKTQVALLTGGLLRGRALSGGRSSPGDSPMLLDTFRRKPPNALDQRHRLVIALGVQPLTTCSRNPV